MEILNTITIDGNVYQIGDKSAIIGSKIEPTEDLSLTDANLNVLVEFADGHIRTKNFDSRKGGNPLSGKYLWTIGDSHKSRYEHYLAARTGCIVDKTENDNIKSKRDDAPYAVGYNRHMQQARYIVEKLYKTDHRQVDYILMEDVHFYFDGNITEKEPFECSEIYTYSGQIFATSNAANAYFTSNFNSLVNSFTPKVNAMIRLGYGSLSQSPKVSLSGTTMAGQATIKFTDSQGVLHSASIAIPQGKNLQEALTIINEIQFEDFGSTWVNANHHSPITGDSITYTYIGDLNSNDKNLKVSYDFGTTGLVMVSEGEIVNSVRYLSFAFVCKDVSEWANVSKWNRLASADKDAYIFIKGVIEYLTRNIPNVRIVIFTMNNVSWNFSTGILTDTDKAQINVKYADGSFNINAIKGSKQYDRQAKCNAGWKNVAEYYSLQFIDLADLCGINANNWSEFYNSNDVHLIPAKYDRIAEVLANYVK